MHCRAEVARSARTRNIPPTKDLAIPRTRAISSAGTEPATTRLLKTPVTTTRGDGQPRHIRDGEAAESEDPYGDFLYRKLRHRRSDGVSEVPAPRAGATPKYGGVVLASDTTAHLVEGTKRTMNAIIRFPSKEAALGLYNDPSYQEAKRIRQASTRNVSMVLVDEYVANAVAR